VIHAGVNINNLVLGFFRISDAQSINAIYGAREVVKTLPLTPQEHAALMSSGVASFYADGNVVKPRPSLPPVPDLVDISSQGDEAFNYAGLPTDAKVWVNETLVFEGLEDGVFSIASDGPGMYFVRVEALPYMPRHYVVRAL
jgi:hypothetical protein